MGKVIRLTESDLTKIVKRVIRENEEQQIADEVTNTILSNISKEDLLTLGKLYNSIGEDEFKNFTEDIVDNVIDDKNVNESIGLSKIGITVDTESEEDKIDSIKIMTRLVSTLFSLITGGASYSFSHLQQQTQENIDAGIVMGIVAAAMVGANLLTRIPHKIASKPLPEKLKDSRMTKLVDRELKKFPEPSNTLLSDVIKHLVEIGIPEKVVRQFVDNWEETNNIKFRRPPERMVVRAR
jgi:hypothetical protein